VSPRHADEHPTRELPTARPSVRTAPPSGMRRFWAAVPHHLGRARTSTVVLTILFLAVGTLYLYVRPPVTGVGTIQQPAGSTEPAPEPTEPVEPTQAPETTEPTGTTAPTPTPSRSTPPTTSAPRDTDATTPQTTTGDEETAESTPDEPATTRAPAPESPAPTPSPEP
jgi:cytoskeletal protein RodZ